MTRWETGGRVALVAATVVALTSAHPAPAAASAGVPAESVRASVSVWPVPVVRASAVHVESVPVVRALVSVAPVPPPVPGLPGPARGPAFRWPLDGPPRPVRDFDPPPQPWLAGHRGVDLAAPVGARVRSAGAGVVLFAGLVAGRPVVTVGHTDGLRTTYEPVRPSVRAGTRVAAGAPLGELAPGHPGCPASACLHWGLRRGEEYLDPLALLGPGPGPVAAPRRPTGLRPGDPGGPASCRPGDPGRGRRAAGWAQRWASRGGRRTARRSYSSGLL
jgi:murein DD-endopeptidase MepM/ murein hydrolase activator NlpD